MIRPLTIATFLLACGSGLYLYQSKHEVQLLDRTIERTVHDTNTLREQSRLLAAEWTMLNDPERLRQFSDTYLSLKTISPTQFSSLADLDSRLPAPRIETPPNGSDQGEGAPAKVSNILGTADPETETLAGGNTVLPVPPVPVIARGLAVATLRRMNEATPARTTESAPQRTAEPAPQRTPEAAPPRGADAKTADRAAVSRPMAADSQTRSADQHAAPRMADARPDPRSQPQPSPRPIVLGATRPQPVAASPATPQPRPATETAQRPAAQTGTAQPANPQPATSPSVVAASTPFNGSLLGAARGSLPPAPRPTPVIATYNSN
jgi:hypothetical protein